MMILDPRQRKGVILLVVITLLTLFAVLGIAFVMYANTTAEGARLGREAQTELRPDVEPELLLSYFLGQLLYDCPDDANGVYSALRGHSLARSMYGLNYDLTDLADVIGGKNSTPYHGTGRLREIPSGIPGIPDEPPDYYAINYTFFPRDGILRDPERPGARTGTGNPLGRPRKPFLGGYNAPYTYPDLNNMYLAAMKADGMLMLRSFHREWTRFGPLAPSNTNWTSGPEHLKYLVLRPRPVDHMLPGETWPLRRPHFPLPADAGGDVKNLIGYPGGNDSIWLDLDAPIMTAPDGRKYKPLFAPLVLDLDNRVNLNVHGNARAVDPRGGPGTRSHASNQGWGPWEVNPGHLGGLINPAEIPTLEQMEWANMFTGAMAPAQRGRMGPVGRPQPPYAPVLPLLGTFGRIYSVVDLDGANELTAAPSDAVRLPGMIPSLPWQTFPSVPPGYGNANANEMNAHPALVNPFGNNPATYHVFPLSNIEALLRYGDTGSPALTSEIFRLVPLNFGNPGSADFLKRRNLVTMLSADIDRPGVTPFFWPGAPPDNNYTSIPNLQRLIPPTGPRVPFSLDPRATLGQDTEFGSDRRTSSALTGLRRLDLNRYLPPYPQPNPDTKVIDDPVGTLAVQVAIRARQYMAKETFELLCRVTGAGTPSFFNLLVPSRREAFRWLAQLAVNIVDFIDADECITPFPWFSGQWVFGTELPRLVINEVYLQYNNHEAGLFRIDGVPHHATNYLVSSWVELVNPLPLDLNAPDRNAALLTTGGTDPFPVYMLEICYDQPNLRSRDNVRGRVDPVGFRIPLRLGLPLASVQPVNGRFAGAGPNEGFHVVGPNFDGIPAFFDEPGRPNIPSTYQAPEMCYQSTGAFTPHTYVLRRLACPNLRENNLPGNALYNPYITVDYLEGVPASRGDGRAYDLFGSNPNRTSLDGRHSSGRPQPFAANKNVLKQQHPKPNIPAVREMPQNSFFQHNVDSLTPGDNWPGIAPDGYPPFDWLVHLDRPLISPMELLHVSAFKPHELTQQFLTAEGPNDKFHHRVPWFDDSLNLDQYQSHRLYRVFEFLTTGHRSTGMGIALDRRGQPLVGLNSIPGPGPHPVELDAEVRSNAYVGTTASGGTWEIGPGSTLIIDKGRLDSLGNPLEEVVRVDASGRADFLKPHDLRYTVTPATLSDRIPGKININTIWDIETFMALCDPQVANGNGFSDGDVKAIYTKLTESRTPGPNGEPREWDRPFLGMGVGNYGPAAALFRHEAGINDTYFSAENRVNGIHTDPRLMNTDSSESHHYFERQLFHKIYNHLTTRSNVFAVWLTVGFFEVIDDTSRPVKLGAELVLADGSIRRHRMFSVVDRSVMTGNPGPQRQFRLGNNPANRWTTGLVVPYYSIIQ